MKIKGKFEQRYKRLLEYSENDDGSLEMTFRDDSSAITFMTVKFDLKNVHEMLHGISSVECDIELNGIENVGKKLEIDKFSFEIPEELKYDNDRRKKLYEMALEKFPDHLKEEGWEIKPYLGSQSSFTRNKEGKSLVNFTIKRYV